jgi:NAD-dependent DNA ligase
MPTIEVKTWSTHYRKLSSELPDYAAWYRANEQPEMTDAEFLAADDFVIELQDFRTRFDQTP